MKLPRLHSSSALTLQVNPDCVKLVATPSLYFLEMWLQELQIDHHRSKASFDCKTKMLQIVSPVLWAIFFLLKLKFILFCKSLSIQKYTIFESFLKFSSFWLLNWKVELINVESRDKIGLIIPTPTCSSLRLFIIERGWLVVYLHLVTVDSI